MTPGCDSREDNNFSSDAEVPTLPAKTLPLSRSRSLKRDIVGTHQIFVFYSLGDVRDGFARDCPLRHPVLPMLALRDRSRVAPDFLVGFRRFQRSRARRREDETRLERGGAGMRAIVSRAGFRGPGGAHVRASRDTPHTDGGSGLGTAQFCRPPRQSLRPRESHPGVIPDDPGLSREALAKLLADSGTSVRVWVQTGHSGPGHRDRGTDS